MARLAVNGGSRHRTKDFPAWPQWDQREIDQVTEVVRSGNWGGSPGTKGNEFAALMAAAHDAKYGMAATNGTTTLQVALKAAGLKAGDEVIVPAITWIATATAALYEGIVPVFVDVEPDTYNMDPEAAGAAITSRTRAIIPVHLGGRPVNLDAILEVARKHDLVVIEDCAHAHGAKWRGRGVGSWGDIGSFSFQSSKTITAGEAGCLITNDKRFEEQCTSLINCGRVREGDTMVEPMLGWNYRLGDFQAAIMVAQLSRLDEWTHLRQENAAYLSEQLGKIPGIKPLKIDARITRMGHYLYLFGYDGTEFAGLPRERFADALNAEGIPSGRRETTVYDSPLFHVDPGRYRKEPCPVAERVAAHEYVSLPHSLLMGTRDDIDDIVGAIEKVRTNVGELAVAAM